jgi:hypothetical protein
MAGRPVAGHFDVGSTLVILMTWCRLWRILDDGAVEYQPLAGPQRFIVQEAAFWRLGHTLTGYLSAPVPNIAEELGMGRNTVRRMVRAPPFPSVAHHDPAPPKSIRSSPISSSVGRVAVTMRPNSGANCSSRAATLLRARCASICGVGGLHNPLTRVTAARRRHSPCRFKSRRLRAAVRLGSCCIQKRQWRRFGDVAAMQPRRCSGYCANGFGNSIL